MMTSRQIQKKLMKKAKKRAEKLKIKKTLEDNKNILEKDKNNLQFEILELVISKFHSSDLAQSHKIALDGLMNATYAYIQGIIVTSKDKDEAINMFRTQLLAGFDNMARSLDFL